MKMRIIVRTVHKWIGWLSGILVIFLGITGCLLVFESEIRDFVEPFQFIEKSDKPFLPPSVLLDAAEKCMNGKKAQAIEYRGNRRSGVVSFYDEASYHLSYLNPFTGEALKTKDMSRDFFRIVLVGHYCLWLPLNIGKPVVACGTLVFAFVMLMGLVLWLYRARKRLAVNWTAKWRRKIYDLHNVFGFYAALIIFTLAVTGLIMGFQWFADAVYWISSGGKSMPVQTVPVSDTVNISQPLLPIDHLMQRYLTNEPSGKSIILYLPQTAGAPFRLCVNNRAGTYYKTDYHFFDRFTLEELTAEGIYSGKYDDMSVANKIMRMNYDIHVGAIGGLPGKILAFFGSLIAASLPVTGFITTLSKRKRKKL